MGAPVAGKQSGAFNCSNISNTMRGIDEKIPARGGLASAVDLPAKCVALSASR